MEKRSVGRPRTTNDGKLIQLSVNVPPELVGEIISEADTIGQAKSAFGRLLVEEGWARWQELGAAKFYEVRHQRQTTQRKERRVVPSNHSQIRARGDK